MDVLEFFAQSNFSLSGLNNKSALFTICKELIDNAFDACKSKTQRIHHIALDISKCKPEDPIQVTCLDDGCGISCDSIESIGEIFNSSKKLEESSGAFGLGLKTVGRHTNPNNL
ncbi:conserved hypothetical protein [Theileria equi strain WA]|uniref:Histidine kinase/HSP90-like ATPase domain-containing protein n=1 Tax=Theileria equi strain WA TaxID=1537102 RepID=L1LG72_THEEQ|nr:conserved hypothetical protein [Theileria equi strain WA]EKX74356.1 conserved hypothetical protein [Theileria equi strain WA]|eukprot:XP_004833808.1 conserved hypothetical protein [Theileria equi strain WA]